MVRAEKNKILVIEDAKGTANRYKTILEKSNYDVTICPPKEVQSLIEKEEKFDLSIIDIVLPPEEPKKFKLKDCQETGIRLMRQMVENNICRRFYVITVRSSLKDQVELLCRERRSILKFEHKLDHEPGKLVDNVANLIAEAIPE